MGAPGSRDQPVDNAAESRFELTLDGSLAVLTYRRVGTRLVLVHTEVPDALEGHGIGGRLVRTALETAIASDLTVVPRCPFARSWLERHPDEAATVRIDWPERDTSAS